MHRLFLRPAVRRFGAAVGAATATAGTGLAVAALPIRPTFLFGFGRAKQDVPVEVEETNDPNRYGSRAGAGPGKDGGSGSSELDRLLDELFGRDARDFDPVAALSQAIPQAFWPGWFEELVDERNKGGSHQRGNDTDSALVDWLSSLAPAHGQWWDWTSELARPFSLHLEDRGNTYAMDVKAKGFKKEDLRLRVVDGILQLSGERSAKQESVYGQKSMRHSVRLPRDADIHNIRVKYTNGTLEISIPKTTVGQDLRIE